MIIDTLEKWENYHFGEVWKIAFEFLQTLSSESEVRKYELRGDDIFAQIASYETIARETTSLESHRKYVDIQAVLSGAEIIETAYRDGLVIKSPYDAARDVEFYEPADTTTKIKLYPGAFAMFLPHDAHMPELNAGETPARVTKVVVKIKKELLAMI